MLLEVDGFLILRWHLYLPVPMPTWHFATLAFPAIQSIAFAMLHNNKEILL